MHNKENINNDPRAQLSNRQGGDPTVDPVRALIRRDLFFHFFRSI